MATQAAAIAPDLVGENHEIVIAQPRGALALQVIERWADSQRLGKRLPDAILEADKIAALGKLSLPGKPLQAPFLSQAAEQAVFTSLCTRLAQQDGKTLLEELAGLGDLLESHAKGSGDAAVSILKPSPGASCSA